MHHQYPGREGAGSQLGREEKPDLGQMLPEEPFTFYAGDLQSQPFKRGSRRPKPTASRDKSKPEKDAFNLADENNGLRSNKLAGMSYRQQVKFIMQKTQQEADWDMDNDSDLKGGSGKWISLLDWSSHSLNLESSEDETEIQMQYNKSE